MDPAGVLEALPDNVLVAVVGGAVEKAVVRPLMRGREFSSKNVEAIPESIF